MAVIYTYSILALPFQIILWSTDALLCLMSFRLALAHLPSLRNSRFLQALRELVDPLPQAVGRRLAAWRQRPTPPWLGWLVAISGLILVRYLAMLFVIGIF